MAEANTPVADLMVLRPHGGTEPASLSRTASRFTATRYAVRAFRGPIRKPYG